MKSRKSAHTLADTLLACTVPSSASCMSRAGRHCLPVRALLQHECWVATLPHLLRDLHLYAQPRSVTSWLLGAVHHEGVCVLRQGPAQSGVVWCGVVQCGVVWCGMVWCCAVWCGVVWCDELRTGWRMLLPLLAVPPSLPFN